MYKAHDIRAFAASWKFLQNMVMESILQARHWKAHNTFIQYYLKDLTVMRGNLLQLGPLMVGYQVL